MAPIIWQTLRALTPVEIAQRRDAQVADDLPPTVLNIASSERARIPILNETFFRHRDLVISKHNRFAPYPLHAHDFLELNYMLAGHAQEQVNGAPVSLGPGDLLLIDRGSRHAIDALGEGDLLINVLLHDPQLSIAHFDALLRQRNVRAAFERAQRTDAPPAGYVLYPAARTGELQATLQRLIEEYLQPRPLGETIMAAETTVLVAQLARGLADLPQPALTPAQTIAMTMLTAIQTDYAQVTLAQLADQLAYNRNYLSNLFRREVGQPFSQALTEERLLRARELIQTTRQPIRHVIAAVGLTNTSFFYSKYTACFGCTPAADREAGIPDL
ncbi:AraC family transcriptional regulator [Lacticaseibacillus absianus]|uniref:AraC family transcriptional regulator n=1 Tax=Lacticaseibacillus absianus TaxID=2729623 RepID=UPI0015CA2AF7|nr:helix-turn-helix domain-containing protein [Lacticaseibacillus absianus]